MNWEYFGNGLDSRCSFLPIILIHGVFLALLYSIMATSQENLYAGFPNKQDATQSAELQSVLSREWETMTLIRLRGCAGWSAPLLFAFNEVRASRVEARFIITIF